MVSVLKTEGLSKHFGSFHAVEDLNLQVEEGDIYGFLGLNGAGKTTTIRMILRLIRPTAGRVSLFGRDPGEDFISTMRDVGALVELPAFYPYLSAWKNLEVLRLATGGVKQARIGGILEQVGLGSRMHDRVRTYSQGMRQRLGIAMALLHEPELVLLDEPTNGLDPRGINEIREVIRDLNRKNGVTFMISSHLLHEMEITCNRVGIIKEGRILLQDTVASICTVAGATVVCEPTERALEVLRALPWVERAEEDGEGGIAVTCPEDRFGDLNGLLHAGNISVRQLVARRRSLEEFFLSK